MGLYQADPGFCKGGPRPSWPPGGGQGPRGPPGSAPDYLGEQFFVGRGGAKAPLPPLDPRLPTLGLHYTDPYRGGGGRLATLSEKVRRCEA